MTTPASPDAISIADQIACVKREIAMRERVYPRWVTAGKMKQEKADAESATMKAVLETLHDVERLRKIASEPQPAESVERMFRAAIVTLADIDEALGLPQDGCNDPEVTLWEITRLRKVEVAATALYDESEEHDFDDGLGRGAPQQQWDDLRDALDLDEPEA